MNYIDLRNVKLVAGPMVAQRKLSEWNCCAGSRAGSWIAMSDGCLLLWLTLQVCFLCIVTFVLASSCLSPDAGYYSKLVIAAFSISAHVTSEYDILIQLVMYESSLQFITCSFLRRAWCVLLYLSFIHLDVTGTVPCQLLQLNSW